MLPSALVIGGTGPTGPYIVDGLIERGYEVTVLHTGRHEIPEVADVAHIHTDPWSKIALSEALADREFDLVVAMYGRLRVIAELFVDRTDRFVSVGGAPAYRGYMNADRYRPAGTPTPLAEDAPRSGEDDDGKSYRVARTEDIVFAAHPDATHLRYPYVYGPRQPAPREWCVVRRILDGRRELVLADGGLTILSYGYVENLAHALLLAIDQPELARGEAFNLGDEDALSLRQVVEIIADTLDHRLDIVDLPWDLATPARPLVQAHRTAHRMLDIGKLRHRLGYRDLVPAREAIARTAHWLAANPPEPCGPEEQALEDPFDYAAEDRLIDAWRSAAASIPDPGFVVPPGVGRAYSGPTSSYQRPDTRI